MTGVMCKLCTLDAVGCNHTFHDPYCLDHLKVNRAPYGCDICEYVFDPGEQVYRWDGDIICAKCLEKEAYNEMVENYDWEPSDD